MALQGWYRGRIGSARKRALTGAGRNALLAVCAVTGLSADAYAVTVEEAVHAALQTNPDIGIVVENRRATEYELEQARAGYLPTLDFRGAAGAQATNDPTTRADARLGGSEWDRMPRYESSLTLSQMLYDGAATESEVELQKSRVISSARRVRETSELVALDAIEAYLEALRQRKLTELAEDNVRLHELTLDMVARKAAGGAATVADVQQAQSRLATAEATLEDARARLRDADATYYRVVGEDPRSLERPNAPSWALPEGLEPAIEVALQNNPTIAVAKADLQAAVNEYEGTESAFHPTVDLELSASADRGVDGVRGGEYDASALVVMRYNLFNGFADVNRRKEFIARIGESRQRYNREVRLTEEQMRLAWNALESAGRQIDALAREVEANDAVRKTYRKQFDLGARSLLELLDSENDLFLSKGQLISKEYLEIFATYRILATSGLLLSALDVRPLEQSRSAFDPVTPVTVDPTAAREAPALPEDTEELAPLVTPDLEEEAVPAPTLEPEPQIIDPEADILEPEPDIFEPEPDGNDQDAALPASAVFTSAQGGGSAVGKAGLAPVQPVPFGFFEAPSSGDGTGRLVPDSTQ